MFASVLLGMKLDLRDEIIGPETEGSLILSYSPSEPIDKRQGKNSKDHIKGNLLFP